MKVLPLTLALGSLLMLNVGCGKKAENAPSSSGKEIETSTLPILAENPADATKRFYNAIDTNNIAEFYDSIQAGANINTKYQNEEYPLVKLVKADTQNDTAEMNENRTAMFSYLLTQQANKNVFSNEGVPLLSLIILNGKDQLIDLMLQPFSKDIKDNMLNINLKDSRGNTPLIYALLAKKQAIALRLIENGADIVSAGENGKSPFKLSRDLNLKSVMSKITTMLAETQEIPNTHALLSAIQNGDLAQIKSLLDWNDFNYFSGTEDILGQLVLAPQNANTFIIADLLIAKGASVRGAYPYSLTPLMRAAILDYRKMVKYLLEKAKSTANLVDQLNGDTALMMSIKANKDQSTTELVNNASTSTTTGLKIVDIEKQNFEGRGPLLQAVLQNNDKVVMLLISQKANKDNAKDRYNMDACEASKVNRDAANANKDEAAKASAANIRKEFNCWF